MKLNYITDSITSIEDYNQSLSQMVPGSKVISKTKPGPFKSFGRGFFRTGFYIGHNITENLSEIKISHLNSYLLTIPLEGKYSVQLSNKLFHQCTPKTGVVVLNSEDIRYSTSDYRINDLMLIIRRDLINRTLKLDYDIDELDLEGFSFDLKNEKFKSIYQIITGQIEAYIIFPNLSKSKYFISNLEELSKMFLVELIADHLALVKHGSDATNSSELLRSAEEIIDLKAKEFFNIQQIADKLHTTPRSLQLLFKKHRNYSPIQFLKVRKLHGARLALLNPTPSTMVKKVALDYGFYRVSTFSKNYKDAFGELPSETLKRSL